MLSFEKRLKYVKEIEEAINTDLYSIPNEDPYGVVHKLMIKKCNAYIRAIAKEHNWQVITKSHPFCEYSCFIKKDEKFVYVHLSDYRWWNWREVLYRVAKHSQDYTGERNRYCDIMNLEVSLMELFEEE